MIAKLLGLDTEQQTQCPKEGDLFKIIKLAGKTFEIRYGFYEECDRHTKYAEPIEIYPNFLHDPQFTDDGLPFVTAVQVPCEYFKGNPNENSTCEECSYYQHGEELIGICSCPMNTKEDRNNEKN